MHWQPYLVESKARESDVHTSQGDQLGLLAMRSLALVLLDSVAVLKDLPSGLDERHELPQAVPEIIDIHDLEEEVGLCLLGKTAPAKSALRTERPGERRDSLQDITLDILEIESRRRRRDDRRLRHC